MRASFASLVSLTMGCALSLTSACTNTDPIKIGEQSAGQSCNQLSDCKAGLDCISDICTAIDQPDVTGRAGTQCSDSSACADSLCCGNQAVCRERRDDFESERCGYEPGHACGLAADCDRGLVCDGSGTCAEPGQTDGQGGVGDACETLADCRRPLLCGVANVCESAPFLPGVACRRSESELGAFRAYFEVPRDGPLDEFYRQPFPSNIRLPGGRPDLTGHPSPGEVVGIDFTGRYINALMEDVDGFGLSQPIFVRFSDRVDRTTLTATAAQPTVMLVNVDSMSPGYRDQVELQLTYNEDPGQFICSNGLGVAPADGVPLRPRTTYALLILRGDPNATVPIGVRSTRGEVPIQDGDFAALFSDTAPSDPALIAARSQFEPLKRYLADANIDVETLAVASVYTTGDPGNIAGRVREAVRAAEAPVVSDITLCDAGVSSPCAEPGLPRDCPQQPRADRAFDQVHARVSGPVLQTGLRPYLEPGADGRTGAFQLDADGRPVVQDTESICVAIALPKTAPPPAGYPVVLYAHGTGGNFLSGMGVVAEDLTAAGIAVLSYDGALHGPRQGLPVAARQDPGRLFFNPANPRGARDNVLQGAGDLFNLYRAAEDLTLPAATTGLGADVAFNASRIMFYGHSQGTVVAPPFLAEETNLRAAVLTGAGAEIGLTLINKRKPNDIAALVRTAFGDQSVSRIHPMIGLLSWFFGPTDGLPYGPQLLLNPPAGRTPLNLLHIYGVGDGFTPEVTQRALIRAGGYPLIGQALVPLTGVQREDPAEDMGVAGNFGDASAGAVQYRPDDAAEPYDGHFVGTRNVGARTTIRDFLSSAATGPALIRVTR